MTNQDFPTPPRPAAPQAMPPEDVQTMSVRAPSVDTSHAGTPPPQAAGEETPRRIGRFEVREKLGEGSFGAVYRARDPQLDRHVAIKVPREGVINTAEDRERFLREARAAATLNHPHICPVYEAGELDGRLCIVMSYVEGKPLSKLIKPGQGLPPRSAANAVRKLALALAEAHAKGVVHRDLKPANIMINHRGEPVVMDFGLARRTAAGDARLTQSGMVLGTPAYMSPEQARGEAAEVGPETDIYSLGVVLYEMLTGARPFEGTVTVVLGQILHVEPRPPRELRPDLDPRLDAICLKCMAKDPAERYSSMADLAAALGDYLRQTSASQPAATAAPPAPAVVVPWQPLPVARPAPQPMPGWQPLAAAANTQQFAAMFAGLKSDLRTAARRQRVPPWVWVAVVAVPAVFFVALGILFFIRTPTATVLVNIDVDVHDPQLTFLLDGAQIAGEILGRPIELGVGDHVLEVFQGEQRIRRYTLSVARGTETAQVQIDETVPADVPAEEIPPTDETDGWITLFDGTSLDGWTKKEGSPAAWKLENGYAEVVPGQGDIITRRLFGPDFELHVEFWIPRMEGRQGQAYGNSGVYLQGRHEIQILATESGEAGPQRSCGALYGLIAPRPGAGRAAGEWQSFDITFHAPRVDGQGRVTAKGRVTVIHNGVIVIDDATFDGATHGAMNDQVGRPGPILLQDHGAPVRFRNIRLRELPPDGDSLDRRAAEWVLSLGGSVVLGVEGQRKRIRIRGAAALPSQPFRLVGADLWRKRRVTDASLDNLAGLTSLEALGLDLIGISDDGLRRLAGLTTLENLRLAGANLTTPGLEPLANMPRLSYLRLSGTHVVGVDVLKRLPALKHLELHGTPITDESLGAVGEVRTLEVLTLRNTTITDAGLAHLGSLPRLRVLDLDETRVGDAGLEQLAGLTKLQRLSLKRTQVTDAGVAKLHAALPGCTMEH